MAAPIGSAVVSIIGDATGLTRSLQRGLQNAFKGAIGVAATAAVAGVFVKGIEAANAWEKNVLRIFQLLPTYSDAAFKEMQGQLVELATSLGANLQEVTSGVYEAVGKGFSEDAALKLVEEASKTSIASGAQLLTVVDGLTSTINAYGQDVLSAKEASAVLFQTFNLGGASVEALASQLYDVTPTAAGLGISFKQVGEALAVLTAAGVPARVATTQMRTAFNELAKRGSAADKNFRSISGLAFPEFVKQGGSVAQAVAVLAKQTKETGTDVTNLFTSANVAGQGFQNLTNRTKAYINVQDKFDPSILGTKVQRGFDIAALGARTTLERARENFNTYRTQFFASFQPLSKGVADLIYGAVNTVGPALQQLAPKVNAAITPIVAGFSELGPEIGQAISDAAERVGQAISAVAAAIQQVWPQVQPTLMQLRDAWNEISPAVQNFANAVIGAIPAVAAAFQGVLSVVGPVIGALFMLAQQVLPPVINAFATAIRWLSQFETAWGAIGAGLAGGAVALGAVLVAVNATRIAMAAWTAVVRAARAIALTFRIAVLALNAAWAANPVGVVVVAVVALGAAFIYAWKKSETFRNIVKQSFNAIVSAVGQAVKFLVHIFGAWVDFVLDKLELMARAWGKVPKIFGGGAGDKAAEAIAALRAKVSNMVDGINQDIDRIVKTVQVDVTMTLRTQFDQGGAREAGGTFALMNEFQAEKYQRAAAARAAATVASNVKKTYGGDDDKPDYPTGTDFPKDTEKNAKAARKAAAKALGTLLKSLGKALDAIARDTGKKTVDQLNTLFRTATERLNDAIVKAAEAGNKRLQTRLKAQRSILEKNRKQLVSLAKKRDSVTRTLFGTKYTLSEAKDYLDDLRKESDDFVSGIRSSITALGAVTRDTGGIQSTFTGMRNNLRKAIAQTNLFVAAMKRLDALDLNKTAQKQLVEAFQSDSTEGLRQAQLLARSGQAGVGEINKLQGQLDKAGASLATNLNNEFYSAGIKAAEGLVKGLQSQTNAIIRQMDKIADAMVNRIKTKLKIHSPSEVFEDEVGVPSAQGVGSGFSKALPGLLRSASAATNQMTNQLGPINVEVNGVSDPAAARRAGILAGQGIQYTLEQRKLAAQMAGVE